MEISSSNMSSYNNNNYLMTFTSKMSKISDKAYKTKVSFPSKPDYLSNSKISKILNNKTLHKKCRTNNNSFSIKEDINKVNKKKDNFIYVQNNDMSELFERNDNKENINLNQSNLFRTINYNRNKPYIKKTNTNKPIIKKENINSLSKEYNIGEIKGINNFITNNKTNRRNKLDKDMIKTKIIELSSLKKLIFDNNSFNNFKFFKKLNKTRNNKNNLNISNNISTINYASNEIIRHKKTKTQNLINNFLTERTRIINRINTKIKTSSKKFGRNIKVNTSSNHFTYSNSIEKDFNKTNYIQPRPFRIESDKSPKENIYLNSNNNFYYDEKLLKLKIKNQKTFDKKQLIERIKKETIAKSQILSKKNKDKENIKKLKINVLPLIKAEQSQSLIKTERTKVIKKVIKIDSCTLSGISPLTKTQKINLDNYKVQTDFLNLKQHFLISLSSGHGSYGHLISKYVCDVLTKKIKNITKENIHQSFISTNKLLLTKSKIDCTLSGASFSNIIITPEKIIAANIGNCKGVLAKYENGQYTAINLTLDHNINNIIEMKRILNYGGVIKNDDKIYIKNSDIPGLNITRSFGDKLGIGIGVVDIPYIQYHYFKGNEKFLLLATNGIWKFIDSDESIKIIKNYYENGLDASGALSALVKESILRWKNEKNMVEDISGILLFFE